MVSCKIETIILFYRKMNEEEARYEKGAGQRVRNMSEFGYFV